MFQKSCNSTMEEKLIESSYLGNQHRAKRPSDYVERVASGSEGSHHGFEFGRNEDDHTVLI